MSVDYDDLESAYMYASDIDGNSSYICKKTGKTYFQSECYDTPEEPIPDDIDLNPQYLILPSKNELDLGKPLVIEFISQHLPSELENVYSIFRTKGAYSRFKNLLEYRGILDKWYEYEQSSLNKALLTWCIENDIEVNI